MLQIARCYGANFKAVVTANPQIPNPNVIFAKTTTVKVPNIGSDGYPYGPPCVVFHTVKSGDTWQSIATQYNANVEIMQAANPGVTTLSAGITIKVPRNSNMGPTPIPVTPIVTVTPTTPVPPPSPKPIRLTFPPGSPSSLSQSGTITTPGTIRYVFAGSAGQKLDVQLIVPTNDVNLAIYFVPTNATVKAPDANATWSGTLHNTGDYAIDLISSIGNPSKTFTLNLALTTPTSTGNSERVADIYAGPGKLKSLLAEPVQCVIYSSRPMGITASVRNYGDTIASRPPPPWSVTSTRDLLAHCPLRCGPTRPCSILEPMAMTALATSSGGTTEVTGDA